MAKLRYDIRFVGRVQGVFFRATTREVARDFAVTGWVRNEPDGSVRCVVEGEASELDGFIAGVETAKRGHVEEVIIERLDATCEFSGFAIRP